MGKFIGIGRSNSVMGTMPNYKSNLAIGQKNQILHSKNILLFSLKKDIDKLVNYFDIHKSNMDKEVIELYEQKISELKNKYKQLKK